ncbi:hypothetical protein RHMOL_Rhmol11G0006000 [Rhododendron molle]|uniref:Uncharacterized protein n=1 Tax=Rhododendron molle TaxID=49168 RepID=A0ACC0LMI9_RHOML|nr:hypothetical protein RHMOL_Rhmol11G0006000 [Rhododendron molle]
MMKHHQLPRNLVAPQGMDSVGDTASNIVGVGTGPSVSTSSPTDSTPTISGCSGAKRLRTSWVWNHFTINEHFKDENGIYIGPRAVSNYCDINYSSVGEHGVGQHGRHIKKITCFWFKVLLDIVSEETEKEEVIHMVQQQIVTYIHGRSMWAEVDVVATYEGLKWQHDVAPTSVFGYDVFS